MTDTLDPTATEASESAPQGEVAGAPWRVSVLVGLVALLAFFGGVPLLVVVGMFVLMIFLHEMGHYLTAKWTGMKVTEFFLFFGPKIWSFRRGETEYGIKLLPLGAYVRIIGMSNMDTDVAPADEPRTYRQQSFPQRALVITAGSMMHFLQAALVLFVAFAFLGVPGNGPIGARLGAQQPSADEWVVGSVTDGSGAAKAGIRADDDIVSIDGVALGDFDTVGPLVRDRAGETVDIVLIRNGEPMHVEATLGHRADDESKGFLGIGAAEPLMPSVTANPITSGINAVAVTGQGIKDTVVNLGHFFTHGVGNFASSVARGSSAEGPVVDSSGSEVTTSGSGRAPQQGDEDRVMSIYGIARLGGDVYSQQGLAGFLIIFAMVNISLGVLNLLPLLPLDGGHLAVATYEEIRSKIAGRRYMADVSRLIPLTWAVLVFFVLLGGSALYLDITDPIGIG